MKSSISIQSEIEQIGRQIFSLIDRRETSVNPLKKHDFYGRLMQWSMQNEAFKTQMFRFVDVLPTLTSSNDVVRHMAEYLKDAKTPVSSLIRGALRVGSIVPAIPALVIRKNVLAMANLFIIGTDAKSAFPNLKKIWKEETRFTVDILGETVVSDREADEYAARYRDLIDFLATATRSWRVEGKLAPTEPPLVNVSVKISALCARIQPTDPASSIAAIMSRLKPILHQAKRLGVFVNLDMEHFGLRDLTIALFKEMGADAEIADHPHLGIVVQAYLHDSFAKTEEFLHWVKSVGRRFTIRLVKGAYWDYEKVIAAQRTWPVPVYLTKPETDANYERISRLLLDNRNLVYPAFASHNVRSIAHVIRYANSLALPAGEYEFQMLYGMAEPIRRALVQMGHRVREYCPVGQLVPGMAYLVRRLLENTSNEGFLRAKFSANRSMTELLRDPADLNPPAPHIDSGMNERTGDQELASPLAQKPSFANEPPADFSIETVRQKFEAALSSVRKRFGRFYPLIIDGNEISDRPQLPSTNPAHPADLVGQVALGTIQDVVTAVAAAKRALPQWSRTPAHQRARFLERIAEKMRINRYELAAWQVFEVGKTWSEADADMVEAIDFCDFYAEEMRRLGRGRLTQDIPGEISIETYLPRGVGAIIAPWNFPFAILCGMTVAAIVTGNTVILKPAEQSSVLGALFMRILHEAGLPDGVANLVSGTGEEVGQMLVVHPEVDFIAFTGSREVGTRIWQMAGVTHRDQVNLKKVICEMGGKNALIVDTDADLDEAVAGIISSAFGFQGQKCSALSRLITVRDIHERLIPRLAEATAALKIGLPERPDTEIGPVIDQAALDKINSYLRLGDREHELAFRSIIPESLTGYFVPPTIFSGVHPSARLAQEEIFGPVLAVIEAKNLEEAIQIANNTPYALTGGVYSRSPENIARVRENYLVGNLYINRSITGAIVGRHPFGGFKMSGGGTKAGGRDYLLQFMFPRCITENSLRRGFAPETTFSV
jgi:RHH-type transcriptional regulator, proline utilization regulon repressor / proline dehydrogenase / delta 1-pyrroline-5-carboxylate dehydrogenase